MAFESRIEELHWEIRYETNNLAYALDERNATGMPVVTPQDLAAQAERARSRKAAFEKELAARELMLIGGDWTFGGADEKDPHPTKRQGTGMDRLKGQFFLAENAQLPELPASGDPGSVLNRYNMTRYFLQGDAATITFDSSLTGPEKKTHLFPILKRLDVLATKEEALRASLKKTA